MKQNKGGETHCLIKDQILTFNVVVDVSGYL